jgi:hypothetical protein
MSDQDQNEQSALLREWRVAQITLVAGLVIALGVVGYFVWQNRQQASSQEQASIPTEQAPAQQAPANETDETALNAEVCKVALQHAKDFGILIGEAQLASDQPEGTDVTGRYACVAATSAAKYLIAFDLVCRDLKKEECVNLFSITQDGGAVLYKRAG